jgi:hypothetical protein
VRRALLGCLLLLGACGRVGYERHDASSRSIVLRIANDLDDGELEDSRSFGTAGFAPQGERNGWIYMGAFGGGVTISYFRFTVAEAIPMGARVSSARMRLYGTDAFSFEPDMDYETIAAENAADPSPITQYEDAPHRPTGRPLTTASARWPPSGRLEWTLGAWNETADFAAAIQELVDRYGLPGGAHIQLFVFRPDSVAGEVAAEDFSNGGGHPAELVLTLQ